MTPIRPQPPGRNKQRSRPRPRRRDALDQLRDAALHVLLPRYENPDHPEGLIIVNRRARLLLRAHRAHEQFARVRADLLDPKISWQAEVRLAANAPGQFDAWFHRIPPDAPAERRRTEPRRTRRGRRTPSQPQAHQLRLGEDPASAPIQADDAGPHARHDADVAAEHADRTRPDGPSDRSAPRAAEIDDLHERHSAEEAPAPPEHPDLVIRLHRLRRPWTETDLQHVFNIIHAQLHCCDAVTVRGHPLPTMRYYELGISAAKAGEAVLSAARLHGLDLRYDPRRHLDLDAHDLD